MAEITGDQRLQVFDMLYQVLENDGFSNLVIKGASKHGFVTAMFYGTITRCITIDFLIRHIAKKDVNDCDPVTRTILRMGAWQIFFSDKVPSFAACSSSVELAKIKRPKSASYINAVLRKLADADVDIDSFKPEIRTSLKSEIYGILKKSYGADRALNIGLALLEDPVMALRVNTLKTDRDSFIKTLGSEGVSILDSAKISSAIKSDGANIAELQSFKDGLFFVQNEAAQLASLIADPHENDEILDTCAAPGGKSTHLAELCNDRCSIDSLDINSSRLKLIEENAARLGITSITTKEADSTEPEKAIGDKKYDIVLCDVPCSGLGLMARKPDIRLTISYDRIQELLPRQRAILKKAAEHVKPGGKLIYSTCTLNRAENEETIQEFLNENPDFVACDISELVPASLIMDEDRKNAACNGMLTIFPDTDGMDGFFISRLERRANG